LGVYHGTASKLMVRVYWQPGLPIWQWCSYSPDRDLKWRSGTIANTSWHIEQSQIVYLCQRENKQQSHNSGGLSVLLVLHNQQPLVLHDPGL
jgi:hypothetical protein